ncbi:MAG: hypothetical protein PHF72_06775 [Gammaproteobacteria bacterium]|nr:hypothetical protein [Gammaproteobacteria bacterium]
MNDKPEALWLHAYSGRETGLMVIGTSASLRALGQQLLSATGEQAGGATGWPPSVAEPETMGPYKDVAEFRLSFHVQGDGPPGGGLPLRRHAMPAVFFLAIGACALVGAVTIARWLFSMTF